jgi:hypothetical protein
MVFFLCFIQHKLNHSVIEIEYLQMIEQFIQWSNKEDPEQKEEKKNKRFTKTISMMMNSFSIKKCLNCFNKL